MYYDERLEQIQTTSQLVRRGLLAPGVNLAEVGILPLKTNRPDYDPELQTCIRDGVAKNGESYSMVYRVEFLPAETMVYVVKDRIKAEARERIISLWGVSTMDDAQIRQTNQIRADFAAGTTDPRFVTTDSIREASNDLEAALVNMGPEELAALVVGEWGGWPDHE